jgi:hypothetical protein
VPGGTKLAPRNKASQIPSLTNRFADAEMMPLPWPNDTRTARDARRPHAHRCINCALPYRCPGPDQSGQCAPLCGPCMWVELGAQLKIYQSMANSIERRRRKIEEQFGTSLCRKAQTRRRSQLSQPNVLAGFGQIVLLRGECGSNINHGDEESGQFRIDPRSEAI